MATAKKGIQLIAETCRRKGIRKVVFSPGSRSAPLVIAFSQMPEMECMVIPDERVAGYFALGIAQQLRETVAVICTSGTAALNLLPAACEGAYQEIPLLFITADRPQGAVQKGENQAINQEFVFSYYAFDIEIDTDNDSVTTVVKNVEEAIFHTQDTKSPARLNVHVSEPLYETTDKAPDNIQENIFQPEASENTTALRTEAQKKLLAELNAATKKLVIIGLRQPNKYFSEKISRLAKRNDFVILVETTSNTQVEGVVNSYDSCIEMMGEKFTSDYAPNIVITLGNQIISKRIRQFVKKNKPRSHWNIPVYGESKRRDYFDLNGDYWPYLREDEALECLLESEEKEESEYRLAWKVLEEKTADAADRYLNGIAFSDLKVFEILVRSFPDGSNIQYGNSTPVRYSNLFVHKRSLSVNSNRGTSGIDGCLSTAAGAAYANKKLTIAIIGDVSFFYDSNALWNNYLSPDLRIIVINNSGGNIFRLIEGPMQVKGFEKFFETRHNLTARHLATMYAIPYYICDRQNELEGILKTFYGPQNNRPAILEIKTDGAFSAEIYQGYFKFLKENNVRINQ